MPHVNQPYLGGDKWLVVLTENSLKRPAPRTIEVIRCDDRATAWAMFRVASNENGQHNKTEDVTGRMPLNWRAFWDWRIALYRMGSA